MAESIFPYVGLPMSLLALAIGGLILWDLLAAYGKTPPPDRAAEGNDLVDFLMHQARLGQPSPADVGTLWHRLMIIWFIGGLMLWYWWYTVAG